MTKADIVIRNATILTVDQERRVINGGAIVIEKDRIKDIGKTDELLKMYQAPKMIDGSNMLVMPGYGTLFSGSEYGRMLKVKRGFCGQIQGRPC